MAIRQDASTGKMVDDGKPAATPSSTGGKPSMHVKVYSPFQTYFDDEAQSISGVNETGNFDILPKHHNFITLLSAGNLVIRTTKDKRTIKIARGMMHVKADKVIVFLDVWPQNLTPPCCGFGLAACRCSKQLLDFDSTPRKTITFSAW